MRRARFTYAASAALAFALVAPSPALAVTQSALIPSWMGFISAGFALVTAAFLLSQVLGFRKVTQGGVTGDNAAYLILAVLCLAASALAQWAWNFLPLGLSSSQARLGADFLVVAAMGLLAVYFSNVRRGMQQFIDTMKGEMSSPSGAAASGVSGPDGDGASA